MVLFFFQLYRRSFLVVLVFVLSLNLELIVAFVLSSFAFFHLKTDGREWCISASSLKVCSLLSNSIFDFASYRTLFSLAGSGSDNYKRKGDEGFGLENPSAKTKRLGVEQQQHQQKLAAQAQHHREQQHREREREASGAASSGKGTRWDLNEAAASSGGDKHPVDLIVLGLPADTDEDDLRTHFERYGNIAFIQVCCSLCTQLIPSTNVRALLMSPDYYL